MFSKLKLSKVMLLSLILLILGGFVIILNPELQGMIFPGNNISIELKLFVNDREVSLDKAKVILIRDGEEKNLKVDNGVFQVRGKEYGEYKFKVIVEDKQITNSNKQLIFNLKYMNANRWYISNSKCKIDLKVDKKGIVGTSEIEIKYNDRTSNVYEQDIKQKSNEINLNWGL